MSEIPKGKRSIKETVYGNTNAYIGRRFWRVIGETGSRVTEREAKEFLSGVID